jgi:hypothetical protein
MEGLSICSGHYIISAAYIPAADSDIPVFDISRFPDELHDKIMDSCDARTMVALARTSKHWYYRRSICMYLRIVDILKFFQLDPTTVLKFLTRTGTVISGSAALLMFYPGLFTPGDLDIYCSVEMLDEVLDFFEAFTPYHSPEEASPSEELTHDPNYEDWVEYENYIARVLKLSCSPQPGHECKKPWILNIIVVQKIEPVLAISHFHSTPVMNIITGNGVVCVYPELTLRMRGIINSQRDSSQPTDKFKKCLDKYKGRGFEFAMSLGRWSGIRRDFARPKALKNMPLCAIAFPDLSDTATARNIPAKVVLEEQLWDLKWVLSEWS